jgi:hypothetical protein
MTEMYAKMRPPKRYSVPEGSELMQWFMRWFRSWFQVQAISQVSPEIQQPGRGVYIELFHGRSPKDEELDDWGVNGPLFGPYTCVHQTYMSTIRLMKANGDEDMLWVVEDLVYYDGVYYGDFTIYSEAYIATQSRKPSSFIEAKSERKPEDKFAEPKPDEANA